MKTNTPLITLFLESKIGRDTTKYIIPSFLKNKDDLLTALLNRNDEWLNYFDSLGGMIYNDVKYLNAIIDSGNTENIKFYNGKNWNTGLKRACLGGNLEMAKLMIEKGANQWNNVLREACQGSNMEIVELMIEKGAYDWNWGLEGACLGGNIDIVKLMIQKGAKDWHNGLLYACRGCKMEIVELMIQKGADDWEYGLEGACRGGHMECVELMIQKRCKKVELGIIWCMLGW